MRTEKKIWARNTVALSLLMMLMMTLVATVVPMTGCALLTQEASQVSPEQVGRLVTIAYLLGKDELKPEQAQAVETAYSVFDSVITSDVVDDADLMLLVKTSLATAIEDPAQIILANALVDMYWDRLDLKTGLASMNLDNQIKTLEEFNAGVQAALTDYKIYTGTAE